MTKKKVAGGILRYVFLITLSLFILVPVLWMVSTAFKTEAETYSPNPIWIPSTISLESFKKFFGLYNFGTMTWNSLITCIGSVLICTAFSCLAGYGVTRFKFRGKKTFMGFLLVTQMFPSVCLLYTSSRYVPLDEFLGFCYLLCGNRRSYTFYQYCSDERSDQMDPWSYGGSGSRGSGCGNRGDSSFYPEF